MGEWVVWANGIGSVAAEAGDLEEEFSVARLYNVVLGEDVTMICCCLSESTRSPRPNLT
jgi:hypothetical protein